MSDIHSLTTKQLRQILAVKEQMEELQRKIETLTNDSGIFYPTQPILPKKRRLSAAGRNRIAAAARARWAKLRGATGKRSKKTRKVSAAVKAKLAAVARERWRKAKAAGKSAL
jgi:hypothetical protein